MTEQLILSFDTSGPHCAVALLRGDAVIAERFETMKKGQAERLMPLIEDVLSDAGVAAGDLSLIGVGIGPGNFTGIRIAVSAARGLALALGIPAIGVTAFDALFGTKRCRDIAAFVALPAPQGTVYLQQMGPMQGEPVLADAPVALGGGRIDLLVTSDRDALPLWLTEQARDIALAAPIAPSIARIALGRSVVAQPRPAPLYLRAADAAPSKEAGPVML